jgi:hypothetical protein
MKQECIIVLGMHRSGTSVAMALCEMQGIVIGNRLFAAREDNPKGFFEHADIIDLNERVFNVFGLYSQDVVPLPEGFEQHPEVLVIKYQIEEVLRRDFSDIPFFGLKDPRMCLLMPLWKNILQEMLLYLARQ